MDVSNKYEATFHGSNQGDDVSDVRDVNQAVTNDLERRHQLKGMSKRELIDLCMAHEHSTRQMQRSVAALKQRVEAAYGDEP